MESPPSPTALQWNSRFSAAGYAYGTQPNDYLAQVAPQLAPGSRVLSLGEGEGRNATFLASLGHRVSAVDASEVGREKALREDFAGLELLRLEALERDVVEGRLHTGRAAVVQVLARRP